MQAGPSSLLPKRTSNSAGPSSLLPIRPRLRSAGAASSLELVGSIDNLTLDTTQENHFSFLKLPEGVLAAINDKLSLRDAVYLAAASKGTLKESLERCVNVPKSILQKLAHEEYGMIKADLDELSFSKIEGLSDEENQALIKSNKKFMQDNSYFTDMSVKELKKLVTILQNDTDNKFKECVNDFLSNPHLSYRFQIVKRDFVAINDFVKNRSKEEQDRIKDLAHSHGFVDFSKCQKHIGNSEDTLKRSEFLSRNQNNIQNSDRKLRELSYNKLKLFSFAPNFAVENENDSDLSIRISYITHLAQYTSDRFMTQNWDALKSQSMNYGKIFAIMNLVRYTSEAFVTEKWDALKCPSMDNEKIFQITELAQYTSERFMIEKWNELNMMHIGKICAIANLAQHTSETFLNEKWNELKAMGNMEIGAIVKSLRDQTM